MRRPSLQHDRRERRDYNRYEPWMNYTVVAILLFLCIALIAAGYLLAGMLVGVASVIASMLGQRL